MIRVTERTTRLKYLGCADSGREFPRPLIPGLKKADSPRWSPDGRTLAFLSDRADEKAEVESSTQIYLLRDGEKSALRLSNVPGGVEEYAWSPDGKMIAFVALDQRTAEEQARRAAGDDAIVQPESNLKYSRLWVVEAVRRTSRSGNKTELRDS